MNGRLKLKDLADAIRIPIVASAALVHVGTGYDQNYMSQYMELVPAVWVVGQTGTPRDDGQGFSGHFTQVLSVDVFFRISVARYVPGDIDPEARLDTLFNLVSDTLKDFTPPGGGSPFVWVGYRDGPTSDSLLAADLTFRTQVRYQRNIP